MATSAGTKIKVMFVMDFIYGITGGTENQVVKIINNLDQSRYDLYLLCIHNTLWLSENSRNLRCSVRAFDYNIFSHRDPRNLIAFLRTLQHIRKIRPDIVITLFPISYILGVLAARLGGVRHIIGTRRDFGLWLNRWSLPLLRFANRFVERIVTNSVAVKELTAREEGFAFPAIDVIYNGIDLNAFSSTFASDGTLKEKLGIPPGKKIVGINAGLRQMKRHRTFLLAAQRVMEARQDVHFLILGDGPMRSELESLASQLSLEGRITFAGWQEDVRPFLSVFDIGVNCSANEGLSNAVMEYMACGVPCIVSAAGGNGELIRHGESGYTFRLDDDSELAALILDLLDKPDKCIAFADSSRRVIQDKFGLTRMIEEYDRYITRIVDSSSEVELAGSRTIV